MKSTTLFLIALTFALTAQTTTSQIRTSSLRCEYLTDPLSIDAALPRLSWTIESTERGVLQKAYEILVASSPKILAEDRGDLWQSGRIAGDQSNQIAYNGKPLASGQTCFWKVRVWDNHGHTSPFSSPATWSMGLLHASDWKGSWIGITEGTALDLRPAPFVRKEFQLKKGVKRAVAYITARGLFIAHLNGSRIGKDILSPEWTDYRKHIQYLTYDVTPMVRSGANCLGMIIGDGWFRGYVGFGKDPNNYGKETSVLLQLQIEYADGTKEVVVTDKTWKGSLGPVLFSDLLMGERYDSRKTMEGWDRPGFDDQAWKAIDIMPPPDAALIPLKTDPIRITKVIHPVKVTEPAPGTFVFDLGQNIAGFVQLDVQGPAGTEVTLRHAEVLNSDGTIYTTNLRRAKATDVYILNGRGKETFEPHFTFHGFRYVEVIGYPGKPPLNAIRGCAINTDLPLTGTFTCSDPTVNQLQSNILWSQRGNFISIPTDCPQRDERLGWMGDAQIFVRTASFNMDVSSFMTKWMVDVTDAQTAEGAFKDTSPFIEGNGTDGAPGWGDAGVIVPWYIYRCYGDTRMIEDHYEAMTRWMHYLAKANPDFLRKNNLNNNYGDWLSINAETPKDMLATAFWAHDAELMADMAGAIGKSDEEKTYRALFASIRDAYQKAYITDDGHVAGNTQTGYVLALAFGLMPDHLRARVAGYLVDDIRERGNHLSTGFIGVKYLNPVLTDAGHLDVAYQLLFNKTFPSWGYPITAGATTIWERWDGWTAERGFQDPGMNSFNHYSMGSVGEWLFRTVGGIDMGTDRAGYKSIVLRPRPTARLTFAQADYKSIYGMIRSRWKAEGGKLAFDVTIPANTTAMIYVPTDNSGSVLEGGKPAATSAGLKFVRLDIGSTIYQAGSGTYHFVSNWK